MIIPLLSCSTGNLHQSLYEIELAIAVGVVVGLDVNRVADDVAVNVAVAVLGRNAARIRKNRLCNAVYEQRFTVFDRGFQTNLGCFALHSSLFIGGALCIRLEIVTDDGQRLRHLDIVVVTRKLSCLHTCTQQNALYSVQLRFRRCSARINRARLTGERQDHGKHQREAGRSLLHVYSLFRGKYRISTLVFIIQRWIFYRSFEF